MWTRLRLIITIILSKQWNKSERIRFEFQNEAAVMSRHFHLF